MAGPSIHSASLQQQGWGKVSHWGEQKQNLNHYAKS